VEGNNVQVVADAINRSLRVRLRQLRKIPPRVVVASPIFLLTLVQILIGAGAGLFVPYANLFFVQHLGASSALFGLIDGGTTTLTALMTLAAPLLAVRIGRVNSIVLTQLASIPLLVSLGLTPLLPLVALFYFSRQPLMDMSMGILQVFSMEAAPQPHRGLANSSYQAGFQVANAITASLAGFIIVQFGYPPLFIGAATCYLLAIAMFWGRFGREYDPLKDKNVGTDATD
ncbi:MAG TPA: MFS transporter, partial [Ktedonobacteraceae bacterium]|nr:MFS transporter [Ktedonobacteraceae bacterium]